MATIVLQNVTGQVIDIFGNDTMSLVRRIAGIGGGFARENTP